MRQEQVLHPPWACSPVFRAGVLPLDPETLVGHSLHLHSPTDVPLPFKLRSVASECNALHNCSLGLIQGVLPSSGLIQGNLDNLQEIWRRLRWRLGANAWIIRGLGYDWHCESDVWARDPRNACGGSNSLSKKGTFFIVTILFGLGRC